MLSLFLKDVMSFFERLKSFLETCYIFLPNPNMFLLPYSERHSFVKVKGCYKTICKDDMGGNMGDTVVEDTLFGLYFIPFDFLLSCLQQEVYANVFRYFFYISFICGTDPYVSGLSLPYDY